MQLNFQRKTCTLRDTFDLVTVVHQHDLYKNEDDLNIEELMNAKNLLQIKTSHLLFVDNPAVLAMKLKASDPKSN